MAYKCSVRKFGTLLYRYGGDLVHAPTVSHAKDTCTVDEEDNDLTHVCLQLNRKCHNQISRMIKQDSITPHKIEQFEIDKFISSLDSNVIL